jgi:hypothetical protein
MEAEDTGRRMVISLSCLPKELFRLVLEHLPLSDLRKVDISINNRDLRESYLEAVIGMKIPNLLTLRLNSSQINWLLNRSILAPVLNIESWTTNGMELMLRNQRFLTHLEIYTSTINSLPLYYFPQLTLLAFYGCRFLPESNILDFLYLNRHLRSLFLSFTILEEFHLQPLFTLISYSYSNLTDLDVSGNLWFTRNYLLQLVQHPRSLLALNIEETALELDDDQILRIVIESHPNLQSVIFPWDECPSAGFLALEHVALPSLRSEDLNRQERGLRMVKISDYGIPPPSSVYFFSSVFVLTSHLVNSVVSDGILIDGFLQRLFEILSLGPPSHQVLVAEILRDFAECYDSLAHFEVLIEAGLLPHIANLVHSGNAFVLSSMLKVLGTLIRHQPQFWEEIHKDDQPFVPLLVSAFKNKKCSIQNHDDLNNALNCLYRASVQEISEFMSSVIYFAYPEASLICLRALTQTGPKRKRRRYYIAICQPNVISSLIRLTNHLPEDLGVRETYCRTLHAIFVTNSQNLTVPIDGEVLFSLISLLSNELHAEGRALIFQCLSAAVTQAQLEIVMSSVVIPFLLTRDQGDDVMMCLVDIVTHALNNSDRPFLDHLVGCGIISFLIAVTRWNSKKFSTAAFQEISICLERLLQYDKGS